MEVLRQQIIASQASQRFGAAEFLRRLASAVEASNCEVEVEEVTLVLRHERLDELTAVEEPSFQ